MTHALALLLCLAGFAAIALGVQRQQEELFGKAWPAKATRGARAVGALALLAALGALIAARGWGLGLVLYSGHTSVAAGAVFGALLAFKRRRA